MRVLRSLGVAAATTTVGCTFLISFDDVPRPPADAATVPDGTTPDIDAADCTGDDLSTDTGAFAVPTGFAKDSWSYQAASLKETHVGAGPDVILYTRPAPTDAIEVEVATVSTDYSSIVPAVQQKLLLLGASITNGTFTAYGCGIEFLGAETPGEKASALRLSGPLNAIKTTVLERANRNSIPANDPFTLVARFEQGTLTCTVKYKNTTATATANNLPALQGSVGLYMQQNAGFFRNLRVCRL